MENHGFVRCAIANFNSQLGSPDSAVERIISTLHEFKKQNVNVAIFPELCLTGYTCQDLFFNPELINSVQASLLHLSRYSALSDILFVVGAPIKVKEQLYNCSVVFHHGEILGIVPKQKLSVYEQRWFTPFSSYSDSESIDLNFYKDIPFGNLIFSSNLGYKLGITVGEEDLFSVIPSSSHLALSGANIIANPSASIELVGKNEHRYEMIKSQSSRTKSAYLFVSSGFSESTSDAVFGGSGYIFENGKELTSFKRFSRENQINICDIDIDFLSSRRTADTLFSNNNNDIYYQEVCFNQKCSKTDDLIREIACNPFVPESIVERNKVCKEVFSIQTSALVKRLSAINCKKVVIGVSGGLDSTLALLVCVEAFKKLSYDLSGIIGITMPGFGTTDYTYTNAVNLCKELGIGLTEVSIKDACIQHFKDINHDINVHDITYENVQARERTQILMDIANKNGALVIGTGDLSELMLGWCTYNGDHMSMYSVNANVPKTLIKHILKWYASSSKSYTKQYLRKLFDCIADGNISPELLPTDGAKVVQKTEDSVGPYEVIDFFIYHLLRNKFSKEKIIYLAKKAFVGKYSSQLLNKYYDDFIGRFFRNQFKRNCLPDGPKVGSVGVSSRGDLLIPSDISTPNWLK